MDINGLAAIVTGGASGLGAATAELLAARGAKVTLFDLNAELGATQAAKIGGRFTAVNVTDEDAVVGAIADAEAVNGKARILVNCAGIGPPLLHLRRDAACRVRAWMWSLLYARACMCACACRSTRCARAARALSKGAP